MHTLMYCLVGAIICALWFPIQGKIFNWKSDKPSLVSSVVWYATLTLYSMSISLISFIAFAYIYFWFMGQLLR
jgi:hypothetical protein